MDLFLLIVAIAVIGYATLSAWLPRTIISSPIFFVASGMLAAAVFGETDQREQLEVLAELTLVVLLFTDASRIDARTLMGELTFPVRLLGIGLPLTVLLGAAVAKLVLPEFTFSEAALVAAMLAPTDAALGQAHRDHVFEVTIITTLLSVILHGVSAVPGAAAYGRFMKSLPEESCEHEDVATHPLRYESTT